MIDIPQKWVGKEIRRPDWAAGIFLYWGRFCRGREVAAGASPRPTGYYGGAVFLHPPQCAHWGTFPRGRLFGWDFIGGIAMGGIMGASSAEIKTLTQKQEQKETGGQGFEKYIQALEKAGMLPDKAAFLDEVKEVLFDAFSGFASGTVSAAAAVGGETAKQYVQKTAKVTDAEGYAKLLQEIMPEFAAENGDATKLQAKDEDNGGATEINVVKNQNNGKIKMGNVDVRKWYKENISKIYDAIDKSLSVEEQAKQAFEARNLLRTEARNMMEDEKARNRLDIERPNKSFEELIESKMKRKGMTREEAIYDILITAKKSNENVDKELGLGDE